MGESVKPIRTSLRTLAVLAQLNASAPATAAEIARTLKMSRATTYRFLETLVGAGYVAKEAGSGRYVPTHLVRQLSCGFEDETWLVDCAKPIVQTLGEELIWPIAVATISGPGMLLRESTDMVSPLAVNRFPPGRRISLVSTASGRVYLAYCSRDQRETLLDILSRSEDPDDAPAKARTAFLKDLAEVKEHGYATAQRTRRVSNQNAIAVPVLGHGRIIASLSVRYSDTAVTPAVAQSRFLPRLKLAASEISSSFESEANSA